MNRKRLIGLVLAGIALLLVLPSSFCSPAYGQSRSAVKTASAEAPHWGAGGVPQFQLDPNFPKVPPQWQMGVGSDVTADSDGNIWVLSRPSTAPKGSTPAPPVMEFDQQGNYIRGWGGQSGPGYQWPSGEHGIFVDYKGYVWIIGSWPGNPEVNIHRDMSLPWDNQILKFTKDGKFVMQIGHNDQKGSNSTEVLGAPTDMYVYPKTNELFVSDGYINARIMVYDADTGKFKRMWGAYGHKPLDEDQRPAPAPLTSDPWRRVSEVLQQFGTPHDVKVSNDGLVYVADRGDRRIQVFTLDGKFLTEQFIGIDYSNPSCRSIAFSPDERFLYVGGSGFMWILNRRTLEILGVFKDGPQNGESPGHLIGTDNKGNIYAAQAVIKDKGEHHVGVYKYTFTGYSPTVSSPSDYTTVRTDLK